jgi:hypothetical protein
MLVYLSLLETNKPYLMTTLRMPLLQTLLLFSNTIETNANFSRLVFDSWIEVKFADPIQGQNQVKNVFPLKHGVGTGKK